MRERASPATRLHDVVVVHEQSGEQCRVGLARIRDGRIVVTSRRIPQAFFDSSTATFRIEALDGGNRSRCFPNLVLAMQTDQEYVFD